MENLPRVLPRHLRAEVDAGQWSVPPVFGWLAHKVGTSLFMLLKNLLFENLLII